ncbi:hypothetical protein EAH75_06470 [Rhodanobacter glycinis]|uniref:hypothetical protein n=1 Tax=Rhodanobacter glycinis TaxID=582702 RepID=UPI00112EB3F5|nr:hypothetical protein [Rhodanobacter glycinis]TPG51036.1 hypothetical protein EAH75_06470 [Rhodanobacter glycinis]
MEAPAVLGYGDFHVEPFIEYVLRWPTELEAFPRCLIENWVYRHWSQFRDDWMPQGALEWLYEKETLSNDEIMQIAHFENDLRTMDYWGDQLFVDKMRRDTWLANFMLGYGTSPVPILVLRAGTDVRHPRALDGEKILEPFQIVEGHMRLSYLRGMIRHDHELIREEHDVWVATAGI